MALVTLLLALFSIQSLLPLRTAIRIGADEDFELGKAVLLLNGYSFYDEVWNDQPLLHTTIVTQALKHVSYSVLVARLVTVAFAAVLLAAVFFIVLRVHGLLVASLTGGLLIASPGFVELSVSCMLEIPGLALALAGLAVLITDTHSPWRVLVAGLAFAAALQIKYIGLILLPIVALVVWAQAGGMRGLKRSILSLALFGGVMAVGFVAIGMAMGGEAFVLELRQSWKAHFAESRSDEYGSPGDFPYQWSVLLSHWEVSLPAVGGIVLALRQAGRLRLALVPPIWCALELLVFATHKPWWPYYYIHNAIPLCWCAAVAIGVMVPILRRRRVSALMFWCLLAVGAGAWGAARIYLQAADIRGVRKTHSAYVLKEIERYRPFAKFIYTDEPAYSFHSRIPMPPRIAVSSLKRFWAGEMTNARLVDELEDTQPGIILLSGAARELPFDTLLNQQYQLVYHDRQHRLYAHTNIVNEPEP